MSEPFMPPHFHDIEEAHDDRDLQIGPLDGPDTLEGPPEPDEQAPDLSRELPIRKPTVGEQLTPEQLEAELDEENPDRAERSAREKAARVDVLTA